MEEPSAVLAFGAVSSLTVPYSGQVAGQEDIYSLQDRKTPSSCGLFLM